MKTIIYRFAWTTIFVLLHSGLNAQTNFRPGYFITLKRDTVYGEIDFRTDRMNSKRCVIREKDGAKEETYHPFDILGYRFIDDGKYYVSKSIELKYGEPQPVFLEYLLQGMRSLYYYENEGNIPVYFVEKDSLLVKVDAHRLAKGTSGYQFKNVGDRYIPILHYVFNDCFSLNARIDKTRFNRDDLVKLAKDYHYAMCSNNEDCIEFEAKKDKHLIRLSFSPLYRDCSVYIALR